MEDAPSPSTATEPTRPVRPFSLTDNMSELSDVYDMGSTSMCIALDKSGSTYGATIAAELDVVRQFCTLRQAQQRANAPGSANSVSIPVLPWCHSASDPVNFPHSHEARRGIGSGGGTDPSSLYQSPTCLAALRSAGIWVLMTDGKIENNLVDKFAAETLEMRIHNKPCVIIVFGNSSYGRPAACNISVGIAVYANVPHCLLLFHDIATGIVRILQAKGNFQGLLPTTATGSDERIKLRVNQYTAWAELPRIAYKALFSLELPTIRDLEPDEMAFQEGVIVNIPDMLAGKVDEALIEKIIHNSDNVRSLALAAQTKGTGKTVADWLISQQVSAPSRTRGPRDIGYRAHKAVSALLEALGSGSPDQLVLDLRLQVRQAHAQNLKAHRRKDKKVDAKESDKTNLRLYNAAKSCTEVLASHRRKSRIPGVKTFIKTSETPEDVWTIKRCGYASETGSPVGNNSPIDSPTFGAADATQLPEPESTPFLSRPLYDPTAPSSRAILPLFPTYPLSDGDYTLTGGGTTGGQQSQNSASEGLGTTTSFFGDVWDNMNTGSNPYSVKDPASEESLFWESSYTPTNENQRQWGETQPTQDDNERGRHVAGERARVRSPSLRRSTRDPIVIPGFERFKSLDKESNELRGVCALCHYNGAVLTLLLKVPPAAGQPTVGFPGEGDSAQITFPLAMGGFTETRALSTFVCCDSCAFHLVGIGTSPLNETVIAAVPMVSLRHNRTAVLEALDLAIRGRIDSDDLLAVFTAMLDAELNEVDRNIKEGLAHADIALFQKSAEWFQRNLNSLVEVPASLSIDFQPVRSRDPEKMLLHQLLDQPEFRDPTHPNNHDLLLLRYPIPGFLVLLRQMKLIYPLADHGQSLVFHKLIVLILGTVSGSRASAKSQLVVGEVLQHVETAKSWVSVLDLEDRGLLEPGTLEVFKRWPHFEGFTQRCGPALTAFLRHWLRSGFRHQSAVAVFNLLKRDEAMRDIFAAPLAMSVENEMDIED